MGNYVQAHPQSGETEFAKRHYGAGAVAGLIAGIVMAMAGMMTTGAKGQGMLMPMKLMAATIFGVDAIIGGMAVVMTGMMIHLVMSIVLGIIFAAIIGSVGRGTAFGLGLAYGVAVWALNTFAILPALDPTMQSRLALMPVAWFFLHLLYGGMLFLVPVLWRR